MNKPRLQRLAWKVALISGGTSAAAVFILGLIFDFNALLLVALLSGFATAAIAYASFLYYVRKFIDNRILTLYKTIYNVKLGDNIPFNVPESDDIILQMQREVTEWMKNRSIEIEDLKKLEQYRREFLGNVSHELKTPVFNIQGYLSTLLEGGIDDPKVNRNYLVRAEKSVERMISIIDDLEAISGLESGDLILDKETFDIVKLTDEVMEAQEMKAKEKNIRLKFRDEYKPLRV
ncbi:MAG TPA: histidine kinase dimerization/phospho-acceptor domain-containing protein, partial [Bacteroidia bacterium]|nr:histidine kinase dimerization/phospho-acceptor domain-containing protein [Bacteroidia bacterium]